MVENSTGLVLTRRDLLTHAAKGAVLLSAPPFLSHAETGTAQEAVSGRHRDSFDFDWKFFSGDAPGAQIPDFEDAAWRAVDLPHDWSIEGPYSESAPSSGPGGYLPMGVGWYRKRFRIGGSAQDRLVLLEFDGIYQNSEVWINGHALGLRPYGFVPFAYDLTPHLRFEGENVVAVRVDNSRQTNCRWYSGSGIYRHTWLLSTGRLRVSHWGTFVTFPVVTPDHAVVQVETSVTNSRAGAATCVLTTDVLDAEGHVVQSQQATQEIAAQSKFQFVQQIPVDAPHLWSTGEPYLYTVRNTVSEAGRVVDEYHTPVGIREAVFDADRGFLLNGKPVKLNGVCLHQEAGCVGSAVPERVWERRLQTLRAMGCNAIRTSHNPYAAEFLDLCDRMGFLLMTEAFDEWRVPKPQVRYGYHLYFEEWHARDLTNMLHRDRNHPSIVLWSAGNEIGDQAMSEGVETLRDLLAIFHREDPTRPVTAACDRIASEPLSNRVRPEFLALLDVVGYNYVDRWRDRAEKYYSIDHAAFPQRRVIGTESNGMGGIRGDYRFLFPASDSPEQRRFLYPQNRALDVEAQWQFVNTYDYVSGDFMWTGIDYLGEAFWPFKGSPAGVLDTCCFPKDGYYFYQSQWTQEPMIHLSPHWNWPGKEGQVIPVTCYTNCDTVELFVNGKSFGVKGYEFPREGMAGHYGNYPARARALRTTGDLHLSWDVPYEAGALKAVGTKNGTVVCTAEAATTGAPAAVVLTADRTKLTAGRRDVAHVIVEVRDKQGRRVPFANNEIAFSVQGAGRLLGVDNGDPMSHASYQAPHRKAFHGLCLAIVQTTRRSGTIQITATSPGLTENSVTLMSQA
jgi:beta-galactosidase